MAIRLISILFAGFYLISTIFAQEAINLGVSQSIEAEIKGGEKHLYAVKLAANQTARIEFEAKGISFLINAFNPKGEKYLETGIDSGLSKNNFIFVTAKDLGEYKVEVSPTDVKQKTAKYSLKLTEIRALTNDDLKFNEATAQIIKLLGKVSILDPLQTETSNREMIASYQEIISLADITKDKYLQARSFLQLNFIHRRLSENQKAFEAAEKCLLLWRELGNKAQQAVALNSMGVAQNRLRNYKAGIANLEEALQIAKEIKAENTEAFILSNLAIAYDAIGESDKAIEMYLKTAEIQRKSNNPGDLGRNLNSLALAYMRAGENKKSEETYNESLKYLKQVNDKVGIQTVFNNLAVLYTRQGELRKSLEFYSQGLSLGQASGDKGVQAGSYTGLGNIYNRLGEYEKSIDCFKKSYALHLEVGSQTVGEALNNLAGVYRTLGDNEQALDLLNQSLEIRRKTQDKRGEATVLANLGDFLEDKNELAKARTIYEQALNIWQTTKDRNNEGKGLTLLGNIERKQKNFEKALALYNQSLESNRAVSNKAYEAVNLTNIGLVFEMQGDKTKALEYFTKANVIFAALEDKGSLADILYNQARVKKDLNQLAEARQDISGALEIIEKLRSNIPSQTLRSSYYATVQKYYELAIEILLKLEEQDSAKDFDTIAFETNERSRSRSLIELLREANVKIREGSDEKLSQREKELGELISQKAFERTRLLGGKFKPEQKAQYDNEIKSLSDELETLHNQIRQQNPRYASLTQATPLSAKEFQNLLDNNTVLLEYKLGETRSFLWLVTKTEVKVFYLPKREEIEKTG
ncbi:MAG TPA: tetratricopeptide repeat protein, partial [Pyrinomonadaceae bacterium]|nr:tetratricopeptide repeat protein [Pyrinomonadaceae bacterium]